jgi:DNA-binding NtrC family response regulator
LTKRILVVDDEGAMGRLIKLNLEQDSHAVTMMTDTNAALGRSTPVTASISTSSTSTCRQAPTRASFAGVLEFRRLAPMIIFTTGDPGMAALPEFMGRTVLAKSIDFALLRRAVADAE